MTTLSVFTFTYLTPRQKQTASSCWIMCKISSLQQTDEAPWNTPLPNCLRISRYSDGVLSRPSRPPVCSASIFRFRFYFQEVDAVAKRRCWQETNYIDLKMKSAPSDKTWSWVTSMLDWILLILQALSDRTPDYWLINWMNSLNENSSFNENYKHKREQQWTWEYLNTDVHPINRKWCELKLVNTANIRSV